MLNAVILQSDPGWLPARRGLLTASRFRDACSYLKSGKESAERRRYKIEVVGERIADTAVDHYVSPAMQRGLDYEAEAKATYEAVKGIFCGPAALILHPTIEFFGATPDGFVDPHGLVEFKVPLLSTYIEWITAGVIPDEHVPQLTAQLAVTRRQWVDFVAYCPEMAEPRNLFIRRFTATEEDIANCEAAARAFLAEVDALFDIVTTAEYAA